MRRLSREGNQEQKGREWVQYQSPIVIQQQGWKLKVSQEEGAWEAGTFPRRRKAQAQAHPRGHLKNQAKAWVKPPKEAIPGKGDLIAGKDHQRQSNKNKLAQKEDPIALKVQIRPRLQDKRTKAWHRPKIGIDRQDARANRQHEQRNHPFQGHERQHEPHRQGLGLKAKRDGERSLRAQ